MFFNKKRYVSYILMIVCIYIYYLQTKDPEFIYRYANIPAKIYGGEYYRLFTAGFFHLDLTHIFCNLLTLNALGMLLERYSPSKFLGVFMLSVLAGNLASYLWNVYSGDMMIVSIGASGGVFGLIGLALGYYIKDNFKFRAVGDWAKKLLAINILYTIFFPGIDIAAHAGGFFAGLVITVITTSETEVYYESRKN